MWILAFIFVLVVVGLVSGVLVTFANQLFDYHKTETTFEHELFYDKNGLYILNVWIDNQKVTVVADTGSAHLVVSGPSCQSCEAPYDTVMHVVPKNPPFKTADTVRYGSQQDKVNWHRGIVSIGRASINYRGFGTPLFRTGKAQAAITF